MMPRFGEALVRGGGTSGVASSLIDLKSYIGRSFL